MPCAPTLSAETVRENIYRGCLSGNVLKVLACTFMLIDHIGMILLPDVVVLRVVGRIYLILHPAFLVTLF